MGKYLEEQKKLYIGKKYNKLTILDVLKRGMVLCKCDCGTVKEIAKYHVINNFTGSCGCIRKKLHEEKKACRVENKDKMILHNNWLLMKFKCSNPKAKTYNLYGGRGIKVCKEWENNYIAFYEWSIANGWSAGKIISLIDKDKDFSPSNVKYVDRRDTQYCIEYEGENLTLVEWAKKLNLCANTLYRRKKMGYDDKSILFGKDKKVNFSNSRNLTYKGETLTIYEWAKKTRLTTQCINYRLARNWSVEQTLETPILQGKQKVTRTVLKITCNKETKSLAEWEKISNISRKIIHIRYYNLNWTAEKAIFTPVRNTFIVDKVLNHKGIKKTIGEWALIVDKTPKQINDRILKGWSIEEALFTDVGLYRKKNAYKITCRGETKSIEEWANLSKVSKDIIYTRLHRLKWDVERAIFTPVGKMKMILKTLTYKGETKTLEEWSKIYNINIRRLNARVERGWTAEQILLTPYKKRAIKKE